MAVCPLDTLQVVEVILNFCSMLSKHTFYGFQKKTLSRIVELLLEPPPTDFITSGEDYVPTTVSMLVSRQGGKSSSIADLSSGLCIILPVLAQKFPDDQRLSQYKDGFLLGVFAPKQEKSEIIYGKVRDIVESELAKEVYEDPEFSIGVSTSRGDRFSWSHGSLVDAKTASESSDKEGFTYHLVIIDEAQLVPGTKVKKELRPMLAATNGKMVLIGTSSLNPNSGFFKDQIKQNLDYEKACGVRNHFEFDFLKVIADKRKAFKEDHNPFHLNYERFVQREIMELGYDADEVKLNYRLQWVAPSGKAFDVEEFEKLGLATREKSPSRAGFQVAAMDVAKDGGARSVVTVGRIHLENPLSAEGEDEGHFVKEIINWIQLTGRFEGETGQYERVKNFLLHHNVKFFMVDATGIGDPVCEHFAEILKPYNIAVIPFKHSVVINDRINKLYMREIKTKRFLFPAGPETRASEEYSLFIEEHDEIVKEYSGNYLQFVSIGNTKDFVISSILFVYCSKLIFDDPELRQSVPSRVTSQGQVDVENYSSLASLTNGREMPQFRPDLKYFDAQRYIHKGKERGSLGQEYGHSSGHHQIVVGTFSREDRYRRGRRGR